MSHNDHESTAAAQSAASVPLARESEAWRRRNMTAAALRRAVELDPALADARNTLGLALMQQGRADEAITAFQALVAADPAHVSARHNLGSALMQKGALEGAVAVYRELTRLAPGNAEAFYNLGVGPQAEGRLRRRGERSQPGRGARCRVARGAVHARRRAVAEAGRRTRRRRSSGPSARAPGTPRHTTCSERCGSSRAALTKPWPGFARPSATTRLPPRPT